MADTKSGECFYLEIGNVGYFYIAGLVKNRPYLVQSYLPKLAPKALLRIIKYVGTQGVPGNVQQAL